MLKEEKLLGFGCLLMNRLNMVEIPETDNTVSVSSQYYKNHYHDNK